MKGYHNPKPGDVLHSAEIIKGEIVTRTCTVLDGPRIEGEPPCFWWTTGPPDDGPTGFDDCKDYRMRETPWHPTRLDALRYIEARLAKAIDAAWEEYLERDSDRDRVRDAIARESSQPSDTTRTNDPGGAV